MLVLWLACTKLSSDVDDTDEGNTDPVVASPASTSAASSPASRSARSCEVSRTGRTTSTCQEFASVPRTFVLIL
jgi:hypothetical protein